MNIEETERLLSKCMWAVGQMKYVEFLINKGENNSLLKERKERLRFLENLLQNNLDEARHYVNKKIGIL